MQVRNPDYERQVREVFAAAAFMRELGVELESIEPGRCVTMLRVSERHLQQDGVIHAAVQAAMADHTAGGAAATLVPPGHIVLTIEYKVNLLRPAVGELLRATAHVLRPGQTVTVVESDVHAIGAGGHEVLTARALVTLAVVKADKPLAERPEALPTRDGYDRWAAIYDQDDNPLVALEGPIVEALLGDLAGLAVVDVGCGTGRHTAALARRGARVTGVDFSAGMLERARAKCAGLSPAPELVEHDVHEPLPFADASFDRVLSALVLDHVRDLPAFFAELGRICRPEGRIVVSTMHPAMMLRGVEARFRDPATGRQVRPRSYANTTADYVNAAVGAHLSVEHVGEHAVDEALAARMPRARRYVGWPMLLVMVLRPGAARR